MRDILVTSSVLILALLVLRQMFRKAISRRMQYALWGLVLLRLLAPVNLPAMEHNVLTTAETAGAAVTETIDHVSVYLNPVGQSELGQSYVSPPDASTPAVTVRDSRSDTVMERADPVHNSVAQVTSEDAAMTTTWYARALPLTDILTLVWYAGIAVMACWLAVSNLRFWRRLRKVRIPYSVEGCKHPVYLVEAGLPSPCLFGLFRPAIYLTPAAVSSPESLRHVLAHEETHARHLDPLWSLLRGVCLAVYWFDPLVWVAAAASRTDCELACDEDALRRLGEAERIAYGRTLLALIPVVKRPADPMLAATTMTSDKRRLKDRITRIAENRQTVSAALFAVAALAALLCAVTFTGARSAEEAEAPLTGAELAYFNETFFNNAAVGGAAGVNVHNQFLSSLYETPEDIDLYSLFYLLGSTPGDAEIRAVFQAGPDELSYPAYRITAGEMDAILSENAGLTLAETNQVSLDRFEVYNPANSAYYWVTGDTGPGNEIVFSAGTREQDTVRLYYTAQFYSGSLYRGWACVTLEAQPDGGYRFVSNLACEQPAIPTVYPEGDPVLTIPLTDLAPYEAPAVKTQRFWAGRSRVLAQYSANDQSIVVCRTFNGGTGVGVEDDGVYDCFLYFTAMQEQAADSLTIDSFSGLFGCDGWVASYFGLIDEVYEQGDQAATGSQTYSVATGYRIYGTVNDYYTFADDGSPVLLVRTYGTPQRIDLDGDGSDELVTSGDAAQITFQRDGQLYQTDVSALVGERWAVEYLECGEWDVSRRYLLLSASVSSGEDNAAPLSATRYVYFDGESLLVYRDELRVTAHVADGVDVPEEVIAAAKAQVLEYYGWWQAHTGGQSYIDGQWQDVGEIADWDDWRITALPLAFSGAVSSQRPDVQAEVYGLGYQLHTTTPGKVVVAGGMGIDEDGWVSGFYDETWCLVFLVQDGRRVPLESQIASDEGTGSPLFRASLARTLLYAGALQPSELDAEDLYYMFYSNQTRFLNDLGEYDGAEQETALLLLAAYAASGAAGEDGDLFEQGLQNLEWNSSALTENGRAAYERLLAAVDHAASLDTETALARFTANPAAFLRSIAQLPEETRQELCQTLAYYYDGGTSAQQARFRDALHAVTQTDLDSGGTEAYELLRTSCALPGPAERTARDGEEITSVVGDHLDSFRKSPGFLYLHVYEVAIDEEETARAVSRYTASLLANGNGWTDEYTSRMVAVRAAYDSYYDFSKPGPWLSQENGIGAMYFYLLPDPISGTWEIWNSAAAPAPSEPGVDSLETAIHNAIMENCQDSYAASMPFQTEAHHVYAIQTLRPDCMLVDAEIVYHAYDKDSSGPTLESGCAFPVVLTFDASIENTLRLTEFWKPLDGEEYTSSIREKVLETEIADELIARAYSGQLSDQCDAAAQAWFESLET